MARSQSGNRRAVEESLKRKVARTQRRKEVTCDTALLSVRTFVRVDSTASARLLALLTTAQQQIRGIAAPSVGLQLVGLRAVAAILSFFKVLEARNMQMKQTCRSVALAAVAAGGLCLAVGSASAQEKVEKPAVGQEAASKKPATKWVELEAGVKQAKASGKPLFVVFRCVR